VRVAVLGPFGVSGPNGPILGSQAELILALALAGSGGLSSSTLRTFLGADPDHPKGGDALRQMTARIRSKLGEAPDNREWVEHLGRGQFAMHPAAELDWDQFHALATTGLRDRHSGDLRAALSLVRGEPFSGCFPWWLETPLIETVRAEIVDVAEMLSDLEFGAGDYGAAIRAAWGGLTADLAAEPLWRAVMRAEYAHGNLAGVRSAWRQCLEAIADIGPEGEPHQETVSLYRDLTRATASTGA
jgi:DNA-binding SARP family transcriptional activator